MQKFLRVRKGAWATLDELTQPLLEYHGSGFVSVGFSTQSSVERYQDLNEYLLTSRSARKGLTSDCRSGFRPRLATME